MQVGETIENYLETILILMEKEEPVRSVDVAQAMDFSKPTISVMMRQLKEKGLVEISRAGHISLTSKGRSIAESVYERHIYLTDLLIKLGVDKETAAADACKVEHVISEETFSRIRDYCEKNIK